MNIVDINIVGEVSFDNCCYFFFGFSVILCDVIKKNDGFWLYRDIVYIFLLKKTSRNIDLSFLVWNSDKLFAFLYFSKIVNYIKINIK